MKMYDKMYVKEMVYLLKNLPIGRDNFRDVIERNLYYVDKTDIIEKILSTDSYVSLFPRPRRFGKSLFLSMVDNFFNIEYKDINKSLFDGLKISKSAYYNRISSNPVIKLDFKNVKQDNYEIMYNSYKEMIRELYSKKDYLKEILNDSEKELYDSFLYETADISKYQKAVTILSGMLYRYYNRKVIILIDEYDVPIQQGYLEGFYDDIVSFIREVFSSSLKGNEYVEFAIMTGVLRVSKESLFSDLNNVEVYGIVDSLYNEAFGFTTEETKELLEYYDLELNDDVKNMYDGYNFNGVDIYNPWSIIKYAKYKELKPYWINTSGNSLIINCIKNCSEDIKVVFEKILTGESVEFIYNEKVTYLDYNDLTSLDNILNLLFISGYLTIDKTLKDDFGDIYMTAKLPNGETRGLFRSILLEILKDDYKIETSLIRQFCMGILNNDKELIQLTLNRILPNISYMDSSESFYHGYLLGLFSMFLNNKRFIVRSNRESGLGRFDLMIKAADNSVGMIIELKVGDKELDPIALKALEQINSKKYEQELVESGITNIYRYAIAIGSKECSVK